MRLFGRFLHAGNSRNFFLSYSYRFVFVLLVCLKNKIIKKSFSQRKSILSWGKSMKKTYLLYWLILVWCFRLKSYWIYFLSLLRNNSNSLFLVDWVPVGLCCLRIFLCIHRFTFIQVAQFKFPAKASVLLLVLKGIVISTTLRWIKALR